MWADLRVVRPGWRVAALRHGTVVPDHALAMALRPQEARAVLDLEADDPRVAQYLQGGSWRDEGPPGFVLVIVDGFPLGWAKRGGGRLHSRYPVRLRRPVPRWGVAGIRRRDR
jgi:NOL1/NOP2/fmu family ribosome biogenesis protein